MTPTDAARMIIKHANNRQHAAKRMLCEDYGFRLSTGLLDAQARIADLEGALRQIRELTEDYEHNQQLSEVWHIADNALTPEGGVS